jgi:hypothetical protein
MRIHNCAECPLSTKKDGFVGDDEDFWYIVCRANPSVWFTSAVFVPKGCPLRDNPITLEIEDLV